MPKSIQWTEDHADHVGVGQKERKLASGMNVDWGTLIKLFIQLGLQLLPFLLAAKQNGMTANNSDLLAEAKLFKQDLDAKKDAAAEMSSRKKE